jgi:hypothetical protein
MAPRVPAVEPLLQLITLEDGLRVEPNAGIVQEHAPVYSTDVHLDEPTFADRLDRRSKLDRDSGIAGEVIQRAKRQNTERHAGARHDAGNGVERPIPPRD